MTKTLEEFDALEERSVAALGLVALMLGVVASDLTTVAAALVEVADTNRLSVPPMTRERVNDAVTRLAKLRADLASVSDTLQGA